MDEQELIKDILSGDTQRFSYFVDTYQLMAYNIAFRIVGNREEAEEAVQDSFVKAYQALPAFRQGSKFSTWFYRIVYNTSVTTLRKQAFFTSYDDIQHLPVTADETEHAASLLERDDRKDILLKAMEKMPADESLLLTLYYMDECTVDEISDITGLTSSNVKVKLFRGRKHFYNILKHTMKHEIHEML